MATPGRNAPCLCGSGKKYKKCCLLSRDDRAPAADGLKTQAALFETDAVRAYPLLLDLIVRLGESRKGEQLTPERAWEKTMEPLVDKLVHHLGTLYVLQQRGTQMRLDCAPLEYVDISSIAVVCRAAIEAYLTFHYIFADARPTTEKEFRFKVWKVGGLRSRQGYPATQPENIEKLKGEAADIERLVEEIKTNPVFDTLSKGQKKDALAGKFQLGLKWHHLAVRAGFAERHFRHVYGHLCGKAHSGYLSVVQVQEPMPLRKQQALAAVYVQQAVMIMSRFIRTFSQIAPKAQDVLRQVPVAVRTAELWFGVSQEMANEWNKPEPEHT